jgi:hypothetical protein
MLLVEDAYQALGVKVLRKLFPQFDAYTNNLVKGYNCMGIGKCGYGIDATTSI